MASRYIIAFSLLSIFFLLLCALPTESVDAKPPFSFSFEKFEKNASFGSKIALFGDAEVGNSTVRMFGKGRMMCRKPIRFLGTNPGFSTYFSFSITKGNWGSLAFLMFSKKVTSVLAVEFGEFVGIKLGDGIFVKSSNLSAADLVFYSGQKFHSWIDYDGALKMIEVRVSKYRDSRPLNSLLSFQIDLSNVLWREVMYVAIESSSARNASITSDVHSWSFVVKHGAPYVMHSEPLNPQSFSIRSHEDPPQARQRKSFSWEIVVALLFGALFGALIVFVLFFFRSKVVKRHPVAPVEYPVLTVGTEYKSIALDGNKVVDAAAAAK